MHLNKFLTTNNYITFKSKIFIALITLIPFFTSCVDENIIKEKVTEQQVADNLVFITDNSSSEKVSSVAIIARLGRNSRGCRGFGICRVRTHRVDPSKSIKDKTLLLKFVSENTLFAELKDFPTLDIDLKDYPLSIDEDISFISDGKEIKILAGTYQYNSSLSKFGGYEITVK